MVMMLAAVCTACALAVAWCMRSVLRGMEASTEELQGVVSALQLGVINGRDQPSSQPAEKPQLRAAPNGTLPRLEQRPADAPRMQPSAQQISGLPAEWVATLSPICAPNPQMWKLVAHENQYEMMRALGVPWVLAKAIVKAPLSVRHVRNGDRWTEQPSVTVVSIPARTWTIGKHTNMMDPLGIWHLDSLLTVVDGVPTQIDKGYASAARREAGGPPDCELKATYHYSCDGATETLTVCVHVARPARVDAKQVFRRPAAG